MHEKSVNIDSVTLVQGNCSTKLGNRGCRHYSKLEHGQNARDYSLEVTGH